MWTQEELRAMAQADAEIERTFCLTQEEWRTAQERDREVLDSRRTLESKRNAYRNRAYYEKHKDEINAYQRAYYEKHRGERNAYQRAYYEKHRGERNAYQRAYREKHRDERNAYQRAYRARKKAEKSNPRRMIKETGLWDAAQEEVRTDARESESRSKS